MANKILKVLVIGDTHDSPDIPDKSRFGWFAKHIRKTKPDFVVQIGDFATFDSCTHYIRDDSYTAKIDKPIFMKDIESLDEAMEELPDFKAKEMKGGKF